MELTDREVWDLWRRWIVLRDERLAIHDRMSGLRLERDRRRAWKRSDELGRELFAISERVYPLGLNFNQAGPRVVFLRMSANAPS